MADDLISAHTGPTPAEGFASFANISFADTGGVTITARGTDGVIAACTMSKDDFAQFLRIAKDRFEQRFPA